MSDLNVHTTSQINALTPITGDMVVDSDLNAVKLYDGAAWRTFNSDSTVVPYQNRWGASFDGSENLSVPAHADFNFGSGDFTWALWVNPTLINDYHSLLDMRSANSEVLPSLYASSTPGWQLYYYPGAGSVATLNYSTGLSTNTWSHIVLTRTNSSVALYLNGNTTPVATGTDSTNYSLNGTPHIGGTPSSVAASGLIGGLDEVAIFNTALSAADITKIYNGTAPNGKPTDLTSASSYDTDRIANLKGYWRMGDDSNDSPSSDPSSNNIVTITDSSGNGNDATQSTANNQPTFSDLTGETIYA